MAQDFYEEKYEIDENSNNEIEEDEIDMEDEQGSDKIKLNLVLNKNGKRINQLKDEIKSEFQKIKEGKNTPEFLSQSKEKRPRFPYDDDYYRDLMFNGSINDVRKIKIELELVDSRSPKYHIWKFYRYHISSMKKTKMIGIQLYYLIKDQTSEKYLGIISLSSDFYRLTTRDNYIGWNSETKKRNLKYIMNISTCIPLQPFGFNFLGGKLMAMLAFSREISQDFINKLSNRSKNPQKYPILGISTTSLYGKGVQYSKLKGLKYLGNTKGWTTLPFSDDFFLKCKELMKLMNLNTKDDVHSCTKSSVLTRLFPKIGIKQRELVFKEFQRGVYFGYLYPNSEILLLSNLNDEDICQQVDLSRLETIDEIFQRWLSLYAIKRYNSLLSRKKLKRRINLFLTKEEKNAKYQETFRKKQIIRLGKKVLVDSNNKSDDQILKAGLLEKRKLDRELYKTTKRYQRKLFEDKYDLEKFSRVRFPRNKSLEEYACMIPDIVKDFPEISNKELIEKLQISSYDSLRTILNKCKKA